MNCVP